MAEVLNISTTNKEIAFKTLIPQLRNLISGESNTIANLANIASAIRMTFPHLWVGFYLVEANELVLGPFQGPIACTRIPLGKGVCGTSWKKKQTIVVTDVNELTNHITCSSESVSEIVVPIFNSMGEVFGVLDIDSIQLGTFDEVDQKYYEQIATLITESIG